MTSFDVVIDYSNWKKNINNPKLHITRKLLKLNQINLFKNKSKNFTLLLTNNKKMRKLNKTFRNKNKASDVLSFPFSKEVKIKKNIYLGDIAISYEIVKKRSKSSNFLLEFDKLWIHGYLHLLGFDHKKNRDYSKMLKEENFLFKSVKSKIN